MADDSMTVGGVGGVGAVGPDRKIAPIGDANQGDDRSFQNVLLDSIRNVDRLQTDAESAIKSVAVGEAESVAEVMTAVEKADLAFRTLMQIRTKLVDAYEELMRLRF